MDPISNVDRLAAILRQRLAQRSAAGAASRSRAPGAATGGPTDRVQALAAAEGVDDRQLRRALIENILSDHLGAELINDARFQQVVERVTDALAADAQTALLMDRLLREMRLSRR